MSTQGDEAARLVRSMRKPWHREHAAYEKVQRQYANLPGCLLNIVNGLQVDDFVEDRMDFGEYVVI